MKVFQRYSLEFDNQLMTYLDFSSYKVLEAGSSYSIVAWVKPYQENSDNGILFNVVQDDIVLYGSKNYYGQLHLTIRQEYGNVLYQGHFGDDNVGVTSVTFNEWLMAGFTFNNHTREQRIYFNNILDKSRIAGIPLKSAIYPIIGTIIPNNSSFHFIGKIGEIRIYDRPLTEEEIQYLYNGGHIEDGLVFWLYPDEDSVTLDTDGQTVLSVTEKINGYIGTAYNGVKLVDGKDIELNKNFIIIKRV